MKAIQNIITRLRNYRKENTDTASADTVSSLRKIGMQIIKEAELTRGTKNKFGNQNDAYGFCIFYDGKEVPDGRGYLDEISTRPAVIYKEEIYGRDAIDEFFDNYDKAATGPFYTLVVANVMPYSYWQEHGLVPNVNYRISILSQIGRTLDEFASQLGGFTEFNF